MNKKEEIKNLENQIGQHLKQFSNLENFVIEKEIIIDKKISQNIKSFIKEIKDISLLSVTVAPFSLTILLSGLNININLLIFSFTIFLLNTLFLNISVWYINSIFSKSTINQQLETISLRLHEKNINDEELDIYKRFNSTSEFFKSIDSLESEKKNRTCKTKKTYRHNKISRNCFFKYSNIIFNSICIFNFNIINLTLKI